MTELKSWVRENQTLVYFLIAQLLAFGAAGVSVVSYMVNLEARVNILETRGSPHLAEINNRLTVTEKETESNKARIDHVIEIMTRELNRGK
jgi:hypothetical protein